MKVWLPGARPGAILAQDSSILPWGISAGLGSPWSLLETGAKLQCDALAVRLKGAMVRITLVVPRVPFCFDGRWGPKLGEHLFSFVNFVGSKLMAMFGFLLAAMVFGLVDATLLVCAATPVAMTCAAIFFCDGCRGVAQHGLRPGDRRLLGTFWGGPIALQPYPGEPAATTAVLMDATGMAAMGALCWAATMASILCAAGVWFLGSDTRLFMVSELVRRAWSASRDLNRTVSPEPLMKKHPKTLSSTKAPIRLSCHTLPAAASISEPTRKLQTTQHFIPECHNQTVSKNQ